MANAHAPSTYLVSRTCLSPTLLHGTAPARATPPLPALLPLQRWFPTAPLSSWTTPCPSCCPSAPTLCWRRGMGRWQQLRSCCLPSGEPLLEPHPLARLINSVGGLCGWGSGVPVWPPMQATLMRVSHLLVLCCVVPPSSSSSSEFCLPLPHLLALPPLPLDPLPLLCLFAHLQHNGPSATSFGGSCSAGHPLH